MLHRLKLSQKVAAAQNQGLRQLDKEKEIVLFAQWQKIIHSAEFKEQVEEAESSFLLPSWQEPLHTKYTLKPIDQPYLVLGVDGSQVYPDRHQRHIAFSLINIGGMSINYESPNPVSVFSEPELIPLQMKNPENDLVGITAQWIDHYREARELEVAVELALELKRTSDTLPFVLLDGSLIFWQLEACNEHDKVFFLEKYMQALRQLADAKIPYASYISLPQSKELVHLVKLSLCRFKRANCIPCHHAYQVFPCEIVDTFTDIFLLSRWLDKNERTLFFKSNSHIIKKYPVQLAPSFTYLSSSHEIGRIELPEWLMQETELCEKMLSIIADQIDKGSGYPLILAEAHEQAVIKNDDKIFFYELLSQHAIKGQTALEYSAKSLKKKRMPI